MTATKRQKNSCSENDDVDPGSLPS